MFLGVRWHDILTQIGDYLSHDENPRPVVFVENLDRSCRRILRTPFLFYLHQHFVTRSTIHCCSFGHACDCFKITVAFPPPLCDGRYGCYFSDASGVHACVRVSQRAPKRIQQYCYVLRPHAFPIRWWWVCLFDRLGRLLLKTKIVVFHRTHRTASSWRRRG